MSNLTSFEDQRAMTSPESSSLSDTDAVTPNSSVDIEREDSTQSRGLVSVGKLKDIDADTVAANGGPLALALKLLPEGYQIRAMGMSSAVSICELSPEDQRFEDRISGRKKLENERMAETEDDDVSELEAMRLLDFDYIPRSIGVLGKLQRTTFYEA